MKIEKLAIFGQPTGSEASFYSFSKMTLFWFIKKIKKKKEKVSFSYSVPPNPNPSFHFPLFPNPNPLTANPPRHHLTSLCHIVTHPSIAASHPPSSSSSPCRTPILNSEV
ncbi:uncharacterized protein DS421_9g260750 [Arachis hypogaea]|nr:uncharacterized protein DS421_9g260750 [Arachis hypogaea]